RDCLHDHGPAAEVPSAVHQAGQAGQRGPGSELHRALHHRGDPGPGRAFGRSDHGLATTSYRTGKLRIRYVVLVMIRIAVRSRSGSVPTDKVQARQGDEHAADTRGCAEQAVQYDPATTGL